jgi:hypothetical protein
VKSLVEAIARKVDELNLVVDPKREREQIVELTVYTTTLAMTFFTSRRMPKKKGVGGEG